MSPRIEARRPVVIVEYNPAWPQRFASEQQHLQAALGSRLLALEHIGSTAVPGLAAKPILDLLGGLRRLEDYQSCLEPLRKLGYEYVAEFSADIPDRRFFRKIRGRHWTHHLHMVEFDGATWRRHLRFRDLLRHDPALARRYVELKETLAARFGADRDRYTDGKTGFIEAALRG